MIAFDPLSNEERVRIVDLHPKVGDLRAEAVAGLRRSHKALPCKYFYDALGARLFEAITELPEYYPTRTELGIMSRAVHEMAESIGPHATLVEFGSGVGLKTQKLLDALIDPSGCVLIDISRAALEASAYQLADRYEDMPGSTIGNFTHDDAVSFLGRVADLVGQGGGLLVGIDRKKDPRVIEEAYNDSLGVTAAFNLNILRRLNQNGANFDLRKFRHHAPFVESEGRIEMRLISEVDQSVQIGNASIVRRRTYRHRALSQIRPTAVRRDGPRRWLPAHETMERRARLVQCLPPRGRERLAAGHLLDQVELCRIHEGIVAKALAAVGVGYLESISSGSRGLSRGFGEVL
jgi:uncharacterized SAM-dependent methyltransferase